MNPIHIHSFIHWAQPKFLGLVYSTSLVCKIYEVTVKHFPILQHSGVLGFGIKELAFDRLYDRFYVMHGSLFFFSGIVGIVSLIAQSILLEVFSSALFTSANLLALHYFGKILQNSTNPSERRSAALGLVNNLGYILAMASYLFCVPALMSFFFFV